MTQQTWRFSPKVLPLGWQRKPFGPDGFALVSDRLSIIVTAATKLDGKEWLHVSCAARDRLPTWDELMWVKEFIIGRDRKAIQVFPPRTEHVNINPYVLHLFHCLDGDGLPDFTEGSGSL